MIRGDFMTVGEVARALKIDESLVTRYVRQGRLAAAQVGRQWLVDRESFQEFRRIPRRRGNPGKQPR